MFPEAHEVQISDNSIRRPQSPSQLQLERGMEQDVAPSAYP